MDNKALDKHTQANKLLILEAESRELLIKIKSETDFEKSLILSSKYSNICYRIESLEKYINGVKDKAIRNNIERVSKSQDRRCG